MSVEASSRSMNPQGSPAQDGSSRCPYCTASVSPQALVCQTCRRDFYLFKPLQARIEALESSLAQAQAVALADQQRIAELQARLDWAAAHPGLGPSDGSATQARSYWVSLLLSLLPALLLLVAAHAVLLFVYDLKPLYLRIASILIPLPFGVALLLWHPRRMTRSALCGFGMAALAVLAMLQVTAMIDKVPLLPQDLRELREVLEYVLSIGLALFTGLLLGRLRLQRLQRLQPGRPPGRLMLLVAQLFTTNDKGELGLLQAVSRVQKLHAQIAPLAAGAASVYAGVKAVIGD